MCKVPGEETSKHKIVLQVACRERGATSVETQQDPTSQLLRLLIDAISVLAKISLFLFKINHCWCHLIGLHQVSTLVGNWLSPECSLNCQWSL